MAEDCHDCERLKAAGLFTQEYIDSLIQELDAADKENPMLADRTLRQERLSVCSECESLAEGMMCSWCGCYVAMRSRVKNATCPYPGNDKWRNIHEENKNHC